MRIGEVADQAGVSVRALRYYEEQDLLRSSRSPGGQRQYPGTAVSRVRFIQQMYAAGLPSRVVREILPCVDGGSAAPSGLLDQLVTERTRIDQQITDLLAVRDRLDHVITLTRTPNSDCSHLR
ncbi:MerR family transcriptional regulator [Streptomyces sp. NPDC093085]|uniref:MerR family transcriptional regulator n=1 Tax=Streptomyces sp. NPDC093085 TaxID=3155068 RepID=UPI0034246CB0